MPLAPDLSPWEAQCSSADGSSFYNRAVGHRHPNSFAFDAPTEGNLAAFTCRLVSEGAPILHVSHDDDGDWQFLCGGQHEDDGDDGPVVACLGCVVGQDPTLNELASMCTGHRADRATLSDAWTITDGHEEFIKHHVKETGWAVKLIDGDDDGAAAFAYTVGLYRNYQHPELIVFGLDLHLMHAMLNICGEKIRDGEPLPTDKPIAGILEGHDVRTRHVRATTSYDDHLGYAIWFYDGRDFPVLQLIWPDKSGQFPDAPVPSLVLRRAQPLLP